MIRVSPLYSWDVRSACSNGMYGQKTGPPPSDVRSDVGPKKPSDCPVARMPFTHVVTFDRSPASPVTPASEVRPRSQYGPSSQPTWLGLIQPVVDVLRKCETWS